MTAAFARVDVSAWPIVRTETVGQSPTVWLRDPALPTHSDNTWLFKPVTLHANGTRQGGDWAEKISGEMAAIIGIPAAEIQLAVREGVEGSLSRNVRPTDWNMHSGRLWLDADERNDYSSTKATRSNRVDGASPGHSLEAVRMSLDKVGPPPFHSDTRGLSGFEVFCGYLMLDSLVANRDRHEDNWSILEPTIGQEDYRLSPSYDHAGTLGYQLTDEGRSHILSEGSAGLRRWVARGDAWRFSWPAGTRPPTLIDLARQAMGMAGHGAESHWTDRLSLLTRPRVEDIVHRIPGMSVVSRTFATEVIMTNSERFS